MATPIAPISFPAQIEIPAFQPAANAGGEFQNAFHAAIQQVDTAQKSADSATQGFISGQDQELHSTILATQNAELQFEMLMQVRNKVVSAYEEVMRMQV